MIIKNNVLYVDIDRGLEKVISLQSSDIDFTSFGTILAQIKTEKRLDAPALFSYSLGSGIQASETTLSVTITEAQSATLENHVYWMDIKARNGSDPYVILADIKLINEETVTDQPT